MQRTGFTVLLVMLCVAAAHEAQAQVGMGQAWTDRGYANLNIGFETTSGTLADATTFRLYDEDGSLNLSQNVDSGSVIDLSAGSRVWRNVSVGIGYHRGGNQSESSVDARVPNPTFFNQFRNVALSAGELDRTEQAFHLQVGYMLPVNEQLSVHVTAGPSFFRLKQDVISNVTFTDNPNGFPFTTVGSSTPVFGERTDSTVGVNIGVDVSYLLYTSDAYRIGGGMFLRYAGASAKITVLENEVDTDVGGLQIGFGGRLRF